VLAAGCADAAGPSEVPKDMVAISSAAAAAVEAFFALQGAQRKVSGNTRISTKYKTSHLGTAGLAAAAATLAAGTAFFFAW
jgi:hypothetical protein